MQLQYYFVADGELYIELIIWHSYVFHHGQVMAIRSTEKHMLMHGEREP